jgi:hypothetical protein
MFVLFIWKFAGFTWPGLAFLKKVLQDFIYHFNKFAYNYFPAGHNRQLLHFFSTLIMVFICVSMSYVHL